jgi:hypothetical protein
MNNNSKKLIRDSFKSISILFLLLMIVLLAIVVIISYFTGTLTPKELINELITSLFGIMIPIVLVNIIYDKLTKSYHSQEVSEKLTEALMLNKDVLKRFTPESKKQFIQNSTESLLGEVEGEMLYSTLIEPYLNNKYNFRRNFRYYISYAEKSPIKDVTTLPQLAFKEDEYYWAYEELSFFRTMNYFNVKKRFISSGFSYKESTLEGLYNKEGFFFRENLWVKEEHINQLQGLSDEEMAIFVKDVLDFRLELNDIEIPYVVSNDSSIEGFYIECHIPKEIELDIKKEFKFKYTFRMPQLKTEKKFLAVVSEPTHSVEIMFSHVPDKTKVVAIPFFESDDVLTTLPNGTLRVEQDGWVLPRAGAVFVWDEIVDAEETSTKRQISKETVTV